jgi:protein TonB
VKSEQDFYCLNPASPTNNNFMDINKILKSDYLDILFDGRNKIYGGYDLRKKYPQRIRKAAVLLFGATLTLSAYPIVAGIINKDIVKPPIINTTILDLQPLPTADPIKPEPKPLPDVPQPAVKPMIKISDPKIEIDDNVKEADKLVAKTDDKLTVGPSNSDGDSLGLDGPKITEKTGGGQVEDLPKTAEIVTVVEQYPEFNGEIRDYLEKHLHYPDVARDNGKEGRSVLRFVVNEDGSISGIEVLRTAGYAALDAEAMRVVSGMPRWKPGKQQGRAVKVYFTLPITFKLDN